MGFLPNYDREGPGIAPDAPRKTGLPRFWETLSRDFWDVFRAGLLALAGCLPFLVGAAFSLHSHVLLFAPVCGLLGGAIAGPELCALADTILRGLRDEPGFWWHTYKRAWKRNARASLLPGAVGGLLMSMQVFLLFHAGALELSAGAGAGLAAGLLLVLAVSIYLWPQLALMDLNFFQLLKNSGLLFLGQLPRSIAALAVLAGYLGLMLRFFPLSASLLPLLNLWCPALPALFLIYPGIRENFRIEENFQ
ncbi:MAG: hypothetical protein HFF69_09310 [Oscillospiraceae bacterium]|jgi:uncharacterized membrane protein YesL|nr:hypothetical protein [Oscillospiraceae bacterium]